MTMTPSYTDITYFIEVAQTENISRAAERLGISQPSLSTSVKRLETSLGVTLLERSRTGVRLTKAGKELLGKGRKLLLHWDQLKAEISKKETEVSGQYLIGCHPSIALCSLSQFLPHLMQKYPDLEISLIHDLSRKITERVISYEIDFGLVVNPIRHPDLVIKELCRDDVMFWTAHDPSVTQNLNPAKGVLICDLDLIQVQTLLNELQKKKLGFRRIINSSSLEVIADLTASGAGIGILPSRVATRIRSYKLKPLEEGLPIFKDKICLIYRAGFQKTKGSQTIMDAIKQWIS